MRRERKRAGKFSYQKIIVNVNAARTVSVDWDEKYLSDIQQHACYTEGSFEKCKNGRDKML